MPSFSQTFGQRIEESRGHSSGFDYMRLTLALGVMCWHSVQVTLGTTTAIDLSRQSVGLAVFLILPLFFALSGFLVSASLIRTKSIWVFMGLRGLRILPALCVEVFLSALLLGPLLTNVDFKTYFTGHEFAQYFLNLIGYIHYNLPGVFMDNPVQRSMNNSLWTVPFEMESYIALFALTVIGLATKPKLLLTVLLFALGGVMAYHQYLGAGAIAPVGVTASGRQLVLFFVAGVTMFMWRDKIPHHAAIFTLCLLFTLALIKSERFIYLTTLPVAYIAGYIGLMTPRKIPVIFKGDYSYGVYLYAFPMQQTVAMLLPDNRLWYVNLLTSIVPICLFAAFSWHVVEAPMLRLKRKLVRKQIELVPMPLAGTLAVDMPSVELAAELTAETSKAA